MLSTFMQMWRQKIGERDFSFLKGQLKLHDDNLSAFVLKFIPAGSALS